MHDDSESNGATFADFQMWDYSPSHRRLLFRSPSAAGRDFNVDLLFAGVREISVPTFIQGLSIGPLPYTEESYQDEQVRRFVLGGAGGQGFYVIAEDHAFTTNYDDLYEAIPDAKAAFVGSSQRYELAIAAELGKLFAVSPTARADTGPDFEITDSHGGRVFVEAKRRDIGGGTNVVRQLTMSLVKFRSYVDFDHDGLLVVLGGQPAHVARDLTEALRTALGTYRVSVVPWEPGEPSAEMESALVGLLHQR